MLRTLLTVALMTAPSHSTPAPLAAGDTGRFVDGEYAGPAGSRRYKLYLPGSGESGGAARPLLVVLHGCTQSPDDIARGTRFNALAEERGVLVLYPEQPASANPQKCWNWYAPAHQGRDAGEPAILAGMTRELLARHGGDPGRVYVAGISAGGAMALTLAATHPDLYAAAAVHSAVPVGAARDVASALTAMKQGGAGRAEALLAAMGPRERVVPLSVWQGTADAVVSPRNAEAIAQQWIAAFGLVPGMWLRGQQVGTSLQQETTVYVTAEDAETQRRDAPAVPSLAAAVASSQPPSALELVLVTGLGHAWSGGAAEGTFTDPKGPDASRGMLRFLLAHRLPVADSTRDR